MSNKDRTRLGGTAHLYLIARPSCEENFNAPQGYVVAECYAPDGTLKWRDEGHNIVTNEGLNDILTKYFKAGTGPTWYVVPIDHTAAPAAGDTYTNTMSDANKEFVGYSETVRQEWVDGAVSSQSISNSGSVAAFSITASGTLYGAALVDTITKGSAASGVLYSRVNFTGGSRAVSNGDTVQITYTFGSADDGA